MGDRRKHALRVQLDGRLKLRFHGAKITSDAGLLAFRELDEAFRLTEKGSTVLSDRRRGKSTQHTISAMLRQASYGRSAGYEDVNYVERLRIDPTMCRVVAGGGRLQPPVVGGFTGCVCLHTGVVWGHSGTSLATIRICLTANSLQTFLDGESKWRLVC